ncbi:MAG: O-antigen ligase family protein [Patescibacteria group bacterium]|jgi:O-antigen ligase
MESLAYILLYLVPFERIPSIEIFGLTARLSTFAILVFVLIFLPGFLYKKKYLPISSIDKSIIAFLLITYSSILVAEDKKRALIVAALLTFVICGYLLVTRVLRVKFNFEKVSKVIIWSALATALFGFFQFFGDSRFGLPANVTGLIPRYTKEILGFARVQSVGMEPLYYANFLFLPIFILSSRILTAAKKPAVFDLVSLTIVLSAFILSLSRGAYAGFAAGIVTLIALLVIFSHLRKHAWKLVIVGLVAWGLSQMAVLDVSGGQGVTDFTEQVTVPEKTAGASTNPRLESYREAIRLFRENPILGVGIGNYGVVSKFEKNIAEAGYIIVNNQYLETLAETGIVGFVSFAVLIFLLIVKLFRALRLNKANAPSIALTLTLVSVLTQYNFFSTIYILYIWIVVALIESMPIATGEGDK